MQMCKCANVQVCKYANVQEFNCASVKSASVKSASVTVSGGGVCLPRSARKYRRESLMIYHWHQTAKEDRRQTGSQQADQGDQSEKEKEESRS